MAELVLSKVGEAAGEALLPKGLAFLGSDGGARGGGVASMRVC